MEASDYKSISALNTTFDGEPIDNSAVLIKYTYYGDANFHPPVFRTSLRRRTLLVMVHRRHGDL
jgi:hypothetical protein